MYHNFLIDSECELGAIEAANSLHAGLANNIFSSLTRDERDRLRNLVTAAITNGESNAMIFPSEAHQLGYLASIRPAREVASLGGRLHPRCWSICSRSPRQRLKLR